jgi:sulfate transport system ATP-binding protein
VAAPSGALDGTEVSAFVRPHEVRLTKPSGQDSELELGTVDRLARIGGNVKLTVTLPSGDAMSVQVSKLELDKPSAKVFVDHYAI